MALQIANPVVVQKVELMAKRLGLSKTAVVERPGRRSPRGGGASGLGSGDSRGVGGRAWGACRAPARGGPRRWGAPWPGMRLTGGAGPEVGEVWSITDAWVMNATRRIAPWPVGHASGSTS